MEETVKGLGQIAWWLPPLIVAIPFAWVMVRSSSTFALRHRFWRLTHPEKSIEDDDVRKAVKERINLMAFRTLLMHADCWAEAKRIMAWADLNGIDPGTLGDCQDLFDRQELKIRDSIPKLSHAKFLSFVIYCFLALLTAIGLDFTFQSGVLLSFKDDHTLFFLSAKSAQLFREQGNIAVLVPADCPKPSGWAGFNATHTASLCQAFKAPGLAEQIDKGLFGQRLSGLSFLAGSLLGMFMRSRRFLAIRSAHAVRAQQAFRRKVAAQQETTESDLVA